MILINAAEARKMTNESWKSLLMDALQSIEAHARRGENQVWIRNNAIVEAELKALGFFVKPDPNSQMHNPGDYGVIVSW